MQSRRVRALTRLLALPVHPLDLQALSSCSNKSTAAWPCDGSAATASACSAAVALQHMRQVTARIARCYCAFDEPTLQRCLAGPHAAQLRSLRTSTLRELRYALRLEHLTRTRAAREAATAATAAVASSNGHDTTLRTSSPMLASERVRTSWRDWFVRGTPLRNTDDLSAIDSDDNDHHRHDNNTKNVHADAMTGAAAVASPSVDGDGSALLSEQELSALLSPSPWSWSTTTTEATTTALSSLSSDARNSSSSSDDNGDEGVICCSSSGACAAPWSELSYEMSLELLGLQQSPFDTIVNEGTLHDAPVNAWFARFCRRRVAWRVLHAHLLHCMYPATRPCVVCADVHLAALLRDAAATVAATYAELRGGVAGYALTIHIDEDTSLLTRQPQGQHLRRPDDDGADDADGGDSEARPSSPRASSRIFAVEGHLLYVFREVIKNACLASYKRTAAATVHVRYAVDEHWAVVDVVDTAGGIAAHDHRRIWTFGWTTAAEYEAQLGGDGVGLPTSHVYLSLWGGSIDVYTRDGDGTTVRVRYPKSPVEVLLPAEATRVAAVQAAVMRGGGSSTDTRDEAHTSECA